MYELPPILRGSDAERIRALRDYLVRLVSELPEEPAAPTVPDFSAAIDKTSNTLRSLIVKTTDSLARREELETLYDEVEGSLTQLDSRYLARSEFGEYSESVRAEMRATAREVVESFDFESVLSDFSAGLGELATEMTSLRGQIRRGVMIDPVSGKMELGIAVSESLSFTGETMTQNGREYSVLAEGQTLGLYTANGWQFWINGVRRGWFDSLDGMLHVSNLAAENSLRLGEHWLISSAGGLGIRYT